MHDEAYAKINEATRIMAAAFEIALPTKLNEGDLVRLSISASASAVRLGLETDLPRFRNLLEIWSELPELSRNASRPLAILLIHGIRTQAEWEGKIAPILEDGSRRIVRPIKYGFFEPVRFLCPLFTRAAPINRILRELRDAKAMYPNHQLAVIAHSFGTYAITEILRSHSDVQLSVLMLCGSIVKPSFKWNMLPGRPFKITNDCGNHDIWPVLAKISTWGFGASGRFGFGTVRVDDRFHDFTHSGCLTEGFAREFWLPLLTNGHLNPSPTNRPTTPWLVSLLSLLHLPKLILMGAAIGIVIWYLLHRH